MAALVKELTARLGNGSLPLSVEQLSYLMRSKLIPAKIIRKIIDSTGDSGIRSIDSADGISGMTSSFHKMLTVKALPELVKNAMDATVNWLYGNLGVYKDTRRDELRWKADAKSYAINMNILLDRMVDYLHKYYPAKAFLTLADDNQLIEKLRNFALENEKSAGTQQPVWRCYSTGAVREILDMLTDPAHHYQAEHTLVERAPKPKATRARKPKTAPPVA